MISLISFEKDLIISKKEAQLLGIKYEKDPRIGFQDERLQKMSSSADVYKEDCLRSDDKYYKNQAALDKDDPVMSYYLYLKYSGDTDYVYIQKKKHLVQLIPFAAKCKHKFLIIESVVSEHTELDNIELIFQRLEEKSELLEKVVDKIKNNTFNKKTNVHVGGGLITTYNDLLLKEDVCTDVLQEELNNGWRIIAVCVQADQRRPDYILGRYNPTLEVVDKPSAGR